MENYYTATVTHDTETITFTVAPGCKLKQDERTPEQIAASAQAKGHSVTTDVRGNITDDYAERIYRAIDAVVMFRWGFRASASGLITHCIGARHAKV